MLSFIIISSAGMKISASMNGKICSWTASHEQRRVRDLGGFFGGRVTLSLASGGAQGHLWHC